MTDRHRQTDTHTHTANWQSVPTHWVTMKTNEDYAHTWCNFVMDINKLTVSLSNENTVKVSSMDDKSLHLFDGILRALLIDISDCIVSLCLCFCVDYWIVQTGIECSVFSDSQLELKDLVEIHYNHCC